MGHRALVAYRRPDHRYDLRYSHWGGEDLALATAIDREQPLADGAVTAEVLNTAITRDRILGSYLDPCVHEALYVVVPADDYAVTPYRVYWLECGDGRDGGRGAIVEVEPGRADRELRTWFRATKTVLADVVEMGGLTRRAALSYLEARICEERGATVYSYDGSIDGAGRDTGERHDGARPDHWLDEDER